MARVVHFEIHADDPEKAVHFYGSLFGWQFMKWSSEGMEYWLVNTGGEGPGINGGLLRRMGPRPSEGQPVSSFVCTIEVEHVDKYFDRVGELGGSIALPKMPIPGVGWLFYAKDPEGNIFGVTHRDPDARAIANS